MTNSMPNITCLVMRRRSSPFWTIMARVVRCSAWSWEEDDQLPRSAPVKIPGELKFLVSCFYRHDRDQPWLGRPNTLSKRILWHIYSKRWKAGKTKPPFRAYLPISLVRSWRSPWNYETTPPTKSPQRRQRRRYSTQPKCAILKRWQLNHVQ
jgi:hypothetical protein